MWVFSSSSLASGFCESNFSLFHDDFRCRQPSIAFLLLIFFGGLGLALGYLGVKNVRKYKNT